MFVQFWACLDCLRQQRHTFFFVRSQLHVFTETSKALIKLLMKPWAACLAVTPWLPHNEVQDLNRVLSLVGAPRCAPLAIRCAWHGKAT